MWPQLFGVPTYILLYTLGVIVHGVMLLLLAKRFGTSKKDGAILGFLFGIAMFPGARILFDILNNRFDITNLATLLYWTCKDCWGLWGGPLVYLAMAIPWAMLLKKNDADARDFAVSALPVAMILAKLACFANGCCYGSACALPWAVVFPKGGDAPAGLPIHPTQIYEIAVLCVVAVLFIKLDRKRWRGTWLAWFLTVYGAGRMVMEFWRPPEELQRLIGPLSASQWICGAASVGAALWLLLRFKRAGAAT